MKSICAWCKKDLGEVPGGEDSAEISHGICESCHEKELKKMEQMKEKAQLIEKKPTEPNFPIK